MATPMFIVTGFLDSGKTTMIKDTLMEQEWIEPGLTLLLLCEEGEEEYPEEYLKEKNMAAFKNGITTVIIPKDNEPDLEDVDKTVFDKVKFIPVRNFSEAVAIAVNNTVRITDNQWNGIDMSAVRSASKTANIVKQ